MITILIKMVKNKVCSDRAVTESMEDLTWSEESENNKYPEKWNHLRGPQMMVRVSQVERRGKNLLAGDEPSRC
jgi:hypothetical protein